MTKKNNNERIILNAEKREIFGKKTKSMRKEGLLPANIYGSKTESLAVQVKMSDFIHTYKAAGETTLVYLKIGTKEHPTLISDPQYHPITDDILHVDFREVNLKTKVEALVPIEFVGESEAVENKNGVLLTQLEEITVSALPTAIPHKIDVDISSLAEIGDIIRVSDLSKSDDYEIIEDEEKTIVLVTEHKEEEIEPETTSEAPEIITAEEGEDGAEEGEENSSEKSSEEKNKE